MTIKLLVPIAAPSLSFDDLSTVKSELIAGRSILKMTANAAGVADGFLQQSLAFRKVSLWLPMDGNTANTIGQVVPTATGTATNRFVSVPTETLFARSRRVGYVSSASAGSLAALRIPNESIAVGGGSLGGFFNILRFGCSDAAAVSGARQFCGVRAFATPSNVEPSAITNGFGVGHGASDTNLKIFYGGTSAQTPIDLGANFPANTLSTDVYELVLFSPKNVNSTIYWRVTRLNTGHIAEGQVTDGTGVILPAKTMALTAMHCWRTNNATALAVGLDMFHHYLETDH